MDIGAIKARCSDVPGIETLTLRNIGGRLVAGFDGLLVAADARTTEEHVVDAIRKAAAGRARGNLAMPNLDYAPRPTSDFLKNLAANNPPKDQPMSSITGAGHASTSIHAMLAARKKAIQDAHQKVQDSFAKLDKATDALNAVGDKVSAEADDLLASIGQISNELVGGE